MEVSIPSLNPAIRKGHMIPAATAKRQGTERPLHPSTAPRQLSHHMVAADGAGITNHNSLLKAASSRRHIRKITTGLPLGPKATTTPIRHTLPLMPRVGLPHNTPPDRIVVVTGAARSEAVSSMAVEGAEVASRVHNGTLKVIMAEIRLPRARIRLTPRPINLPAAMPKTYRTRATV